MAGHFSPEGYGFPQIIVQWPVLSTGMMNGLKTASYCDNIYDIVPLSSLTQDWNQWWWLKMAHFSGPFEKGFSILGNGSVSNKVCVRYSNTRITCKVSNMKHILREFKWLSLYIVPKRKTLQLKVLKLSALQSTPRLLSIFRANQHNFFTRNKISWVLIA